VITEEVSVLGDAAPPLGVTIGEYEAGGNEFSTSTGDSGCGGELTCAEILSEDGVSGHSEELRDISDCGQDRRRESEAESAGFDDDGEDECVSDAATSPITVSLMDSRCEEAIFIYAAFDVDVARE
jgi:hypothetical protein